MAVNDERDSISALVEETKETEEMAEKLHDLLKRKGSVDKMRAIRVDLLGHIITEPPPPPDDKPKKL